MKHLCFYFFLVFTVPAGFLAAQADSSYRGFSHFNAENDYFNAQDLYYTQGLHFEFVHPVFTRSFVFHALIRAGKNASGYSGLLLHHKVFTASLTNSDSILRGDRPFAGCLYLGQFRVSENAAHNFCVTSMIYAGVIGPNAHARQMHERLHKVLHNAKPHGYGNQIANDVVLNYDVYAEKIILASPYLQLGLTGKTQLGTLFDNAGIGINCRGGIFTPGIKPLPLRNKKFELYGNIRGEVDFIGYDATMQGGVFNKSSVYTIPAGEIERLVYLGGGGVTVRYKHLLLEYTRTWITPEFKGGKPHGWGSVGFEIFF